MKTLHDKMAELTRRVDRKLKLVQPNLRPKRCLYEISGRPTECRGSRRREGDSPRRPSQEDPSKKPSRVETHDRHW